MSKPRTPGIRYAWPIKRSSSTRESRTITRGRVDGRAMAIARRTSLAT